MELSIAVLLSNLVGLFSLIGVGFVAVRAKVLPAAATGPLTSLLLKIALPATIFSSMIRPFDPGFVRDAATVIVIGTVLYVGYALLSGGLARLFRVPQGRRGMWMMCVTFSNNGFMGFPVAYALFGEEGLALAVMLGVPFNLLIYSLGAKQISLDQPEGTQASKLSWKTVLFSAVNLSILLGLVFYCCQLPVPEAVLTPIQHLSNITTPLSMIITGMNLAVGRLPDLFRDRDALTCVCTRLVILPLLTWAALLLLPVGNPLVVSVLLVIAAMPSPAVASAMAERYDGCRELAARAVCLSSLLCIVTLPLISLLL